MRLDGIHHVTLICGDAGRTLHFYTRVLGFRLVKHTVNFDDPTSHHVYFGDETGRPGTLMTFFDRPDGPPGRVGAGTVHHVGLAVADTSGFANGGDDASPCVRDPDGILLDLTARPGGAPAIRHVTAVCSNLERTVAFYERVLGLRPVQRVGPGDDPEAQVHLSTGDGAPGTVLSFRARPGAERGRVGRGLAHHVAFAVASDVALTAWREHILAAGIPVTPVMDRRYFHSIYLQDPDGLILELATVPPGFAVDEPVGRLGSGLQLPPWLEHRRADIASRLRPLHA